MQLTRAADYAVRVMIYLAAQPAGTRVSRDGLATAADVPAHFLSKVLQSLGRARLIVAQRGYESNSKVVQAADEMYQDVNNLAK